MIKNMNISGIIQFILGFILGCVLLIGGTGSIAYFMLTRMAAHPPKPVFSEEKAKPEKPTETKPVVSKIEKKEENNSKEEKPAEKPKEEEKLEPGAYKARVTWSTGLSLRAEPNGDAERIGGVAYNQNIIILEESPDQQWQKIRFPNSEQTGWIKAGNIEKVTDEN
jgi:Bacterial SH3 domain